MSSDQGVPLGPQRPYNGPAAPRFAPRQNNTGSSPQLYDQYQNNEYYNQKIASYGHQNYPSNGRGNGYSASNQEYKSLPSQQSEHHGGRRGVPVYRGGGSPAPEKRSASEDGMKNGYNQRRPPESGQQHQAGFAGRGKVGPLQIEKSGTTDPVRAQISRKPVNMLASPEQTAWDNPFPTFPGAKKKTSQSEEQEILRMMAALEMGGTQANAMNTPEQVSKENSSQAPPESFPRTGPSQKRYPLQGKPKGEYFEPNQALPASGYSSPARNQTSIDTGYGERGYGPHPEPINRAHPGLLERSRTLPTSEPANQTREKLSNPVPNNIDSGSYFPPNSSTVPSTRQRNGSLDDIYNTYHQTEKEKRRSSLGVEMPNFDYGPNPPHKKGNSFELHMQAPSYVNNEFRQTEVVNTQPDASAQPNFYAQPDVYAQQFLPQGGYDYGYDNSYENNPQLSQGFGPAMDYNGYNEPLPLPPPNNFQIPPRSTSAQQGFNDFQINERDNYNGYPSDGYSNYTAANVPEEGKHLYAQAGPYSSMNGGQVNNKPIPIRNYGNTAPTQQFPQESPENDGSDPTEPAPVTAAELEYLRNTIKINPADQASQLQLARRLIDASESLVKSIPDQRSRNKARERYVMDAHKLLKKLVAQQNPDAMFYLADCYGRGALGLETDYKEAFSLYQSAAKVGHAAAAYRTAVCCELGNEEGGGTRKDPLKATQWYKRAAMLGDTPAMYKMGIVLLKGLLGQPRNPREAIGWLKRAAERADAENPHALHELALLYEQPQGTETSVVRDEMYSFQLFQQAADLGYKFSQFRLGCAYEYGLFNCPIDPRLSILWYSRAAAQGEHQSELALSGWYLTGSEGVLQQSDTEAYLWARKAAMAGLAKAEYAMGYFTEIGIGSPANLEDAKRWYWRAAAQNFPKARERLEDLKRGGNKAALRSREKISRSKRNPKEGLY